MWLLNRRPINVSVNTTKHRHHKSFQRIQISFKMIKTPKVSIWLICLWKNIFQWLKVYFGTCTPAVCSLFGTRDQFHGRQFFHGPGVGGNGFRMNQVHLLCTEFLLLHCDTSWNDYTAHHNMNQGEPWAGFPATRWSHLGLMGDSDTWTVLLMSTLLCDFVLVTVPAENPASQKQDGGNISRLFRACVEISGYSALTLI